MTTYPPLTTRIQLQLQFLIRAINNITIAEYMSTRSQKYENRSNITPINFTIPSYFSSWLSGFIEAEGSFAIRSGSVGFSFSISQTNDFYLIQAIRDFFGQSQLKVQQNKNIQPLYFLEIRNIKAMQKVVTHCIEYPLIGHKYYQLATVIKKTIALSNYKSHFWIEK